MKHPLLLLLICCGLCTAVSARPIRGTVKCGGRPLAGVAVTDGYTFAQSDAQGAFALDADDEALFISVVTPAGYIAPLKEGVPQFFLPYTPSAKRFDFEPAGVARNRGMLRTAGHRRPATQDRRAFRTAPHRDNPAAAGCNSREKGAGSRSGRHSAGRHRMGLAAVVRQSQGAVRIARNPRLRRDRQPRPRPEQIHRPRSHRKLPFAFRPHVLRLRHGPHPLRRSRRHRLPRRPQIRRADRLDAGCAGRRPTPNVCRRVRASASRCTLRP